jgi:hypothetical protein
MIPTDGAIANQHQLQLVARKAGLAEGCVFGDRVILAIAFSGGEAGKRRTPSIGFAVLGKIAGMAALIARLASSSLSRPDIDATVLINRRNWAA